MRLFVLALAAVGIAMAAAAASAPEERLEELLRNGNELQLKAFSEIEESFNYLSAVASKSPLAVIVYINNLLDNGVELGQDKDLAGANDEHKALSMLAKARKYFAIKAIYSPKDVTDVLENLADEMEKAKAILAARVAGKPEKRFICGGLCLAAFGFLIMGPISIATLAG